jgi:hypothetical protein
MQTMNRMQAIKTFFEKDGGRKVDTPEMAGLWKTLTTEEKQEFSEAAAKQLGVELSA